MASEIKSDKLSPSTGTALQIGDASDTITIPTGATFTITDGLGVAGGGTGLTSFTAGDVLYATGTTTLAKLAKGTAEQILSMNSGATAPEWATAAATAGGTGQTGFTAGDILYANSTTTLTKLAKGTGLQGLQTNSGATAPQWADSPQSLMTAQGDILYASGANTLAKLAKGSASEVLAMNTGATAPEWVTAGGGTTVKRHYFPFSTRTAGNASAGVNQFTWTAAFTPTDPTVNDLLVHAIVPSFGGGQNVCGYGTRFTNNSSATNYDSNDNGIIYTLSGQGNTMSMFFNFPAGTIPAGTYTAYLHTATSGSQAGYYFPNATEDVRYSGQSLGMLFITEWKN